MIFFPFVIAGALGKGEMREGRSICVMIDERALEDFIKFYIYSSLYCLDSDGARMSKLPHSSQSRGIRVAFCCVVPKSLIVDAAYPRQRVHFSGRDCMKREGDIIDMTATIQDGLLVLKIVLHG